MKLEGVIHCEGPDCDTHQFVGVRTMAADRLPTGWLVVTEHVGAASSREAFCGWDCLMKRAALIEPPLILPAGGE